MKQSRWVGQVNERFNLRVASINALPAHNDLYVWSSEMYGVQNAPCFIIMEAPATPTKHVKLEWMYMFREATKAVVTLEETLDLLGWDIEAVQGRMSLLGYDSKSYTITTTPDGEAVLSTENRSTA